MITTTEIALKHKIFSHISACKQFIDALEIPDIFLKTDYLQAVEKVLCGKMEFRYILLFADGRPVGFSYCQIYPFSARESIRGLRSVQSENFLKVILANWVEFTAFVCGNLLLSGQHGYYFLPGYESRAMKILHPLWQECFEKERTKNRRISVQFIKDMPDAEFTDEIRYLEKQDYFRFRVQPAMVVKIQPQWKEFDDYLMALKSKYRIRLRQAMSKSNHLSCRELTLEDLIRSRDRIQHLLNKVLEESDFRIVHFDVDYLIEVKMNLHDFFKIRGFYVGDQLLGFMTYFITKDKMLAHFTGFDTERNKKLDLYLNMLIDLISQAISFKVVELDFSRTALEIKSSVGAEPVPMTNFLWHYHCAKHRLLPKLFRSLYSPEEWVQRRPFRNNSD